MALAAEAAMPGDLCERHVGCSQEPFGFVEAHSRQIAVRRNAEALLESSGKISVRQAAFGSETGNRQRLSQRRAHQVLDALFLPCRQSAPHRAISESDASIGLNGMGQKSGRQMLDEKHAVGSRRPQVREQEQGQRHRRSIGLRSRPRQPSDTMGAVIPAQIVKRGAADVELNAIEASRHPGFWALFKIDHADRAGGNSPGEMERRSQSQFMPIERHELHHQAESGLDLRRWRRLGP